jgi:hypothetical protein
LYKAVKAAESNVSKEQKLSQGRRYPFLSEASVSSFSILSLPLGAEFHDFHPFLRGPNPKSATIFYKMTYYKISLIKGVNKGSKSLF